MKALSAKKTAKVLEQNGFIFSRQKGSHRIYRHLETGIIVPVPFHGKNKLLPIGTFLAIVKQSKISRKEFE